MQRSSEIDIRVPSNFTTQQVEDILRQKIITEPTEVVSQEGTIYVHQQMRKPPKDDGGDKKSGDKKSGDKKRSVKKSGGKKPGKKK